MGIIEIHYNSKQKLPGFPNGKTVAAGVVMIVSNDVPVTDIVVTDSERRI